MTLNLTTRKNGKIQKILGTHVWDDEKKTIVVRYSQAYRPEGHDYTRSFKVLRLAYWLKHHLLDQDDIATYETLQLLCEIAIPFTLDRLAEECKVGKSTLRQRLDNLENAELLTIHKTADGQGRPNYYILRTPYFEKDTIIGDSNRVISRQDRILFDRGPEGKLVKSGRELPVSFLEDQADRLRRQIRKNKAKKLRQIACLQKKYPKLYKQLKTEAEEKNLVWHSVVKRLGSDARAVELADYIWRLARSGFAKSRSYSFGRELRSRIEGFCDRMKWPVDKFLVSSCAEKLYYFYELTPTLVPAVPSGLAIHSGTATRPPAASKTPTVTSPKELTAPKIPGEQVAVWQAITAAAHKEYGENVSETWFKAVQFEGVDKKDRRIKLRAEKITREWINSYYAKFIVEVLADLKMPNATIDWLKPDLDGDLE